MGDICFLVNWLLSFFLTCGETLPGAYCYNLVSHKLKNLSHLFKDHPKITSFSLSIGYSTLLFDLYAIKFFPSQIGTFNGPYISKKKIFIIANSNVYLKFMSNLWTTSFSKTNGSLTSQFALYSMRLISFS